MSTKRKKYSKISTSIVELTPELAQEFLDNQTEIQRKPSQRQIDKYIHSIKYNLWKFDGSSLRINWFGEMIDGQQRCQAVIDTKKSIEILIVYGLDPECFKTIDTGKSRTLADVFHIEGEKYYQYLACAINLYHQYSKRIFGYGAYTLLTFEEAIELLNQNPRLRKSIESSLLAKAILSPGIGGFLHYIFSKKDKQKANEYFKKLTTGENFRAKDPIRIVRDMLLQNKIKKVEKMGRPQIINIIVKSWNMFRNGDNCSKKITWRNSKQTIREPYQRAK